MGRETSRRRDSRATRAGDSAMFAGRSRCNFSSRRLQRTRPVAKVSLQIQTPACWELTDMKSTFKQSLVTFAFVALVLAFAAVAPLLTRADDSKNAKHKIDRKSVV